jgi:FKBP-type peptidyl-prolyl cis-trans isomerase (trigger factor)
MSSNMPPVPPGNRSNKGPANSRNVDKEINSEAAENKSVKPEKHHNAAEEGDTANIKQNTTNKGFYRGRRMG